MERGIQAQEPQMVTNKPTPRCTIIKMAKAKDKERTLKAEREKQRVNCKETKEMLQYGMK